MFRCVVQCVLTAGFAILMCVHTAPSYAQLFPNLPQTASDPTAAEQARQSQIQRRNSFLLRGPTGRNAEDVLEANETNTRNRRQNRNNTFDERQFLLRAGVDSGADEDGNDDVQTQSRDAGAAAERDRPVVQSRVQEPVARLEQPRIDRLEAPDLRGDRAEIDAIRTGTIVEDEDTQQTDAEEEVGPYDPIGGRVGRLSYFPTLEIRGGFTDNAGGSSVDPAGSSFQAFRSSVDVQSDWSRHEFTANGEAEYTLFNDNDEDNDLSADAEALLRLDVTSRTTLELGGTLAIDQTSVGDSGAPVGTTDRPLVIGSDIFTRLSQRFNRLTASILAGTQQETNQDGQVGSITVDNSGLDFREDRLEGELTYELSPITDIGVRGTVQRTEFDSVASSNSNSEGYAIAATIAYRPSGLWGLEGSVGFESNDFDDPSIGTIEEIIYDATLTWRPTILTSVAFAGGRSVDVTTESGASAVVTDEISVSLTHDFRENISLSVTGLAGFDDFIGSTREDERIEASAELLYRLNRYVAFIADFAYEQRDSNLDGFTDEEISGSAGVRFSY